LLLQCLQARHDHQAHEDSSGPTATATAATGKTKHTFHHYSKQYFKHYFQYFHILNLNHLSLNLSLSLKLNRNRNHQWPKRQKSFNITSIQSNQNTGHNKRSILAQLRKQQPVTTTTRGHNTHMAHLH